MQHSIALPGVLLIAALLLSPSLRARTVIDSTLNATNKKGGHSPFTIIKTIESVGSEILSLFGGDSDADAKAAAPAGRQGQGRRQPVKILISLEPGTASYNADVRTCQSGTGICSFKIFVASQTQATPQMVSAQARYFPRQKRVQITFDSAIDAQYKNSDGKVLLSVHRGPGSGNDENGTVVLGNRRLTIKNGDYEVVNNMVSLFFE